MRENSYLKDRLEYLWANYFSDAERDSAIKVRFGRNAIYRFGSIRYCYSDKSCLITINGRFKDEKYPAEIIDHTLSHELVHYVQGFPTPGPALHRFPHRGGVIDKELRERNLSHLVEFYNKWVKSYLKMIG